MSRTPREVLVEAARLVRLGWCQGEARVFSAERCSYCAIGAVSTAAMEGSFADEEDEEDHERSCDAAISALEEALGARLGIVAWNDDPGRTAEEVAQALERAAERCT